MYVYTTCSTPNIYVHMYVAVHSACFVFMFVFVFHTQPAAAAAAIVAACSVPPTMAMRWGKYIDSSEKKLCGSGL